MLVGVGAVIAVCLGAYLVPSALGSNVERLRYAALPIVLLAVSLRRWRPAWLMITGVVLAAAILTILPELFREFASYRMPVYALALIVVMIVRPQGLFGIKELWDTALWRRLTGRAGIGGAPRAIAKDKS